MSPNLSKTTVGICSPDNWKHVKRYQSIYYTSVQMCCTGSLMRKQLRVIEWFDNTFQHFYYLIHISVQSLVQPWFRNCHCWVTPAAFTVKTTSSLITACLEIQQRWIWLRFHHREQAQLVSMSSVTPSTRTGGPWAAQTGPCSMPLKKSAPWQIASTCQGTS